MSIPKREVALQRLLHPYRRARLRRSGVVLGRGTSVMGMPIVEVAENSSVRIGDECTLVSSPTWTALGVSRPVIIRTLLPGARITIGANVGMSGTTVCAARSVMIGDRVLFGADAMVVDTDFHPLDEIPRRGRPIPPPDAIDELVIGDDAFIGARAIILKGSAVGAGAVIGAGAVVTGEVAAGAVVAGNPARFIRWVAGRSASRGDS